MKRGHLLLVALVLLLLPGQAFGDEPAAVFRRGNWQVYGDGPHYLELSGGFFDIDEDRIGAARIELRWGEKLLFVGPAIGLLVTADRGVYGYGGIYADIVYRRLVFTPLVGAGGYSEGDGKDLGGTFLFRASITLSYQFDNLIRLGVQGGHLSNGHLYDRNPSEQDGFITLAIPF